MRFYSLCCSQKAAANNSNMENERIEPTFMSPRPSKTVARKNKKAHLRAPVKETTPDLEEEKENYPPSEWEEVQTDLQRRLQDSQSELLQATQAGNLPACHPWKDLITPVNSQVMNRPWLQATTRLFDHPNAPVKSAPTTPATARPYGFQHSPAPDQWWNQNLPRPSPLTRQNNHHHPPLTQEESLTPLTLGQNAISYANARESVLVSMEEQNNTLMDMVMEQRQLIKNFRDYYYDN
jgi:hypothetical protein